MTRTRIWLAAIAAVFMFHPGAVSAQTYPTKPVRIIIGYAPGGATDISTRIFADKMSQRMGQRFIVENRPGASTTIAAQAVAKSPPDGYTLWLADIALGANPALNKTMPYDAEKAFSPIVLAAFFPAVVAVEKSLPVKNLKEFLDYAKSKNGELNYSSAGIGSMNYLASELLKMETGINIVHVPYQSGGEAMAALVGGYTQMLIATAPPIKPFAGKVNILAVSSDKRLQTLPDVPTVAEAGMPNFKMALWEGFLAPAGTDKKIIEKLNTEFNAVFNLPDVRARLATLGGDPVGGTPEHFATFIHDEIAKWKKVIPADIREKR